MEKIAHKKIQGFAVILLMIVLIIATGIGIWGLTSSRSSLLKSGNRKFSAQLNYQADQNLQKAVRRLQGIAMGTGDAVATQNANDTSPGKTGGNYSVKTIDFLMNSLCPESTCGGTPNAACTNFDPVVDFDVVNQNVVCNFLGVVDKSSQVIIVRKNNLTTSGKTFAIFLINSIAYDNSGRKQIMQGVVSFPFLDSGGGVYVATESPSLASTKIVTD